MSDYVVKLVIGAFCMIILAGILAGSKLVTPAKSRPVKPEVIYVIQNGKVVGAASAVPYTKDGNIQQIYVPEAILEPMEAANGSNNVSNKKVSNQ